MRRVFLRFLRLLFLRAMGAGKSRRGKNRTRFKIAGGALAWVVIALLPVIAQSPVKLRGYVFDADDGSPVIHAVVELQETGYRTLTDENGSFLFEHLPLTTYHVSITAPGYVSHRLEQIPVVEDVTSRVVVFLKRKIYRLEKLEVVEKYQPQTGASVTVLRREQIQKLHPTTVGELLEEIPGVFVQHSGGSGVAHVRLRGAEPKQVLVLLDGQKVNPSGNGVADLNTIPIEMVERIEVHKGGASARFGMDALGGVINIITQKQTVTHQRTLRTETGKGSWEWQSNRLALQDVIGMKRLSTRFAYHHRREKGDFPFSYSVAPRNRVYEGVRINNGTEMDNFFGSGVYRLSPCSRVKFSSQWFDARRGLPDRASKQNPYAYTDDKRRLVTLRCEYEPNSRHRLESQVGFSRFEQYFWDKENPSLANRFETRYVNDIFSLQLTHVTTPWNDNEARTGIDLSKDVLTHTDYLRPTMSMGKAVRTGYAAFFSDRQRFALPEFLLFDEASVDMAMRYDRAQTVRDASGSQPVASSPPIEQWSPRVGAALSWGSEVSLVVRGSYGKSFRLPSVNALFWKGDVRSKGNPDLRPERSEHSEGGIELIGSKGELNFKASMTYFHSFMTDLVVWQSGYNGVWSPVNLGSALLCGHEEDISIAFFDELVEVRYQNTITTTRNKVAGHNSYNKSLTFTPHYVTGIRLKLKRRFGDALLQASYAVRKVAKRYALLSNTKWYDAYRIDDVRGTVSLDLSSWWHLAVDVKIANLWNEEYVLLTHYPMPGREWRIGVRLTYGKENKQKTGG